MLLLLLLLLHHHLLLLLWVHDTDSWLNAHAHLKFKTSVKFIASEIQNLGFIPDAGAAAEVT